MKLLGDGVMLRFPSIEDAAQSVGELLRAIDAEGLPPGHAGIAAGQRVVRDGDVDGHTVNLAARLATHAVSGEVLVAWDEAERLAGTGVQVEDAGEARLIGLDEPVRVGRIRQISPRRRAASPRR